MRKLLFTALAIGLACAAQAGLSPAKAEIVYPWCAHYLGNGLGGAPSCGFTSYRQCMAAASGMGMNCQRNPAYDERMVRHPRRDRY
jgi:hypothetical protein